MISEASLIEKPLVSHSSSFPRFFTRAPGEGEATIFFSLPTAPTYRVLQLAFSRHGGFTPVNTQKDSSNKNSITWICLRSLKKLKNNPQKVTLVRPKLKNHQKSKTRISFSTAPKSYMDQALEPPKPQRSAGS